MNIPSVLRIAAVLVVAAVLAGCTGSSGNAEPRGAEPATSSVRGNGSSTMGTASPSKPTATTGPPATSSTTTAAPNPAWTPDEQAVTDAYQRAMNVFDRTGRGGLPVDPDLPATMVDPMLNHVRVERTNEYDRGEAARFPPDSKRAIVVKTVKIDGAIATVTGCSVDDAIVYKVATGEVVNDDVSTADFVGTLRRIGGDWKLATWETSNSRSGVEPCS